MDQVVQSVSSIAVDVAPRMARAAVNDRDNILLTGRIAAFCPVAEARLLVDGEVRGRITYGSITGAAEPGTGPSALAGSGDRRLYDFAFNLIRPLHDRQDRIGCSIVVLTEAGEEERDDYTLLIDPARPEWAFAKASRMQQIEADALRSPMLLYVESATTDGRSRIALSGWVVSRAQILAVQVFDGERRIGLARTGIGRADVEGQYPDYPGSHASGFVLNLGCDGLPPPSTVRVQAIARSGNAYEVVVPLAAEPAIPHRPDPPSEPDPVPVLEEGIGASISLHCDEAILSTAGGLIVGGWCMSDGAIAAIRVRLDGAEVGQAELGRPRPDVGAAYPTLPHAAHAGFRFAQKVRPSIEGTHQLVLIAQDHAGQAKIYGLELDAVPVPEPDTSAQPAAPGPDESCKLFLDTPATLAGVMTEPVTNRLFLDGWGLARGGVKTVEIELDGMNLGPAFYGQRREDIAGAFPDWDGALLSGFAFHFPARALASLRTGLHDVQVRLTTQDGEQAVCGFSFQYERRADDGSSSLFRRTIPWVERELLLRIVRSLDWSPMVRLLLVLGTGADEPPRARAALRSLREQVYDRWRVTIVAAGDMAELAAELADEFADLAERVEVWNTADPTVLERPLGSLSEGYGASLFAALRAGDEIACDALAEMVIATARDGASALVYSDEIRRNPATGESEAFFKPAWSPDLLLSANYIGRFWCAGFGAVQRSGARVEDLLRFGAFDLVLRVTEQASAIRHVARVLWQQGPAVEGPAHETQALQRAAARRGVDADVLDGCLPGIHRLRRTMVSDALVSIIIPTAGAKGHIQRCIPSLRRTRHKNIEIVCLDNIADEAHPCKQWLRDNADTVVEIREPFNWSRFNNIGAARAKGDYLLFLNDDTEVLDEAWLDALLEHAQRPEVGVVGPQLLYPDGKVQHAGLFLTGLGCARHAFRFLPAEEPGYFGLARTQRNVIAVTGACMLVRRETFDVIGGFDEAHAVINNDLDFCLRAVRHGLLVVYTPHTSLIHYELASRAELSDDYRSVAFDTEWAALFAAGDPYYSPHLSKGFDDYRPEEEATQLVYAGHPLFARSEIRRILAVKLDHIGDFITALPALRRLKRHFPDSELHVLCGRAARSIAALEPSIDSAIEFEFFHARSSLGRKDVTDETLGQLRSQLADYRFDLAVDLRKHPDTRSVLRATGARLMAGFDVMNEHPWLDIALEWEGDRKLHPKRHHVSDDLLRLVDAVGLAGEFDRTPILPERRPPPLPATALPAGARKLLGRTLVIVHPGVGQETRQWPSGHFATLIDLLVEQRGVNVALIGSPDETALAKQVMAQVRNRKRAVSLVGKIPLKDLPGLIVAAALYVGNNSGPKHLAAALGVPTIGIHSGVVDATEWGPLGPTAVAIRRSMSCSPCYIAELSQCIRHYACMRGLEPAAVFDVCKRMLNLVPAGSAPA